MLVGMGVADQTRRDLELAAAEIARLRAFFAAAAAIAERNGLSEISELARAAADPQAPVPEAMARAWEGL
jgi:hypothetical protein